MVASSALLVVLDWMVSECQGEASEMKTFTEDWESEYNHKMLMASVECVACNALQRYGHAGKEDTCMSHCFLVVPPDAEDQHCEEFCEKLRAANLLTSQPCMALGHCPAPLVRTEHLKEEMASEYRPVVIIGHHREETERFERQIADWTRLSLPGVYVRLLYLVNEHGTENRSLEYAYRMMLPLHKQIERVCEVIEDDGRLQGGFDLIAIGMGGILARGYVQACNAPPVKTLITYNTPHAGCKKQAKEDGNKIFAAHPDLEGKRDPYSPFVQSCVASAGVHLDHTRPHLYYSNASLLPDLNLQRPQHKFRPLDALDRMILVYGEADEATDPRESAWFEDEQAELKEEAARSEEGGDGTKLPPPRRYHRYASLHLDSLFSQERMSLFRTQACRWKGEVTEEETANCRREITEFMIAFLDLKTR